MDSGYWSIIKFVHMVILIKASSNPRCNILQIGLGNILSALMISKSLKETGNMGKLFVLCRPSEVKGLRETLTEAGLIGYIDIYDEDEVIAINRLPKFIDAVYIERAVNDERYDHYLKLLYPKLKIGSIVLAHPVDKDSVENRDFVIEILDSDRWVTQFLFQESGGVSFSIKRI